MSLINQVFRQKVGYTCPPDLEDKLVFDYLFPELWSVMNMPPWNLQQDICLLRKDENGIGIIENYLTSTGVPQDGLGAGDFNRSVWTEYLKQCDWKPIQIINHLRSVECPILYTCSMPPLDELNGMDYIEIRELTIDDVIKRGGGSYEATKEQDKKTLSEILDEIIFMMDEFQSPRTVIKIFPKINSTATIMFDY